MDNILHVSFGARREMKTEPRWQGDYGQVLVFDDIELPLAYEVHFSNNPEDGEAIGQIGNAEGVTIPDQFFLDGRDVYAWIFLHAGEDDGETRYMVRIPVRPRPDRSDEEPSTVQQSEIDQLVAGLNAAVDAAEAARDAAQAAAGDFQGITAEAETTDPDTGATIEVTHSEGGLYHFAFGIPQGEKGDQGDQGEPGADATDEQVATAVDAWLDENITNPSNPPLDTSLTLANAAAPADKVGKLKDSDEKLKEWVGYTEQWSIPVIPTAIKGLTYDNGTYRCKYANGKEDIGITKASGQTFQPNCNITFGNQLTLADVCYDLDDYSDLDGEIYIKFSVNYSTSDFDAAKMTVQFYFCKDGPTHQKTVYWTIPSTGEETYRLKISDLASENNVDLTVCHYFCVRGILGDSFTSTSQFICDIYVDGLTVKGNIPSINDIVTNHEERIDDIEEEISDLEDDIESNTDRITALESRPVSSGGGAGVAFALTSLIPDYYFAKPATPAAFDDIAYIESKIASVPDGKHFIFITDTHWSINKKKSTQLIGYIKERLKIESVFFGGDAITWFDTKYLGYQSLSDYGNASKAMCGDGYMWCMGNHDNNMANATGTEEQLASYAIPYSQIAKLTAKPYLNYYTPTAKVNELISDADDRAEMMAYFKNCYYFDSGTTRYIIYNTGTVANNQNPAYKYFAVSNVSEPMLCIDWLYATLLSTPENYDVVVIGHEATYNYGQTYFTNSNKHVPTMLRAFKKKASASVWIPTNWDSKLFNWISSGTHTYDFANANTVGKVFMLQGHWHKDFFVTASQSSGYDANISGTGSIGTSISVNQSTAMELPIITTTCDAMPQPSEEGRVADTVTEQAFDVVTLAENKVYFTRIGGGSDRVVTFT